MPSIDGRRLAAISGLACPRNTCPTTCVDMRRRSTPTATGGTSRCTATSGTRGSTSDGVRITGAAGSACVPTAGPGLPATPGAGPPITMDGGASPPARGSGSPGADWAPAWVSWASAPGYVSWCPLGWNNRPIFALNVNVYGGRRYDPWACLVGRAAPSLQFRLRQRLPVRVGSRRCSIQRAFRRRTARSRRALRREPCPASRFGASAATRGIAALRVPMDSQRGGGRTRDFPTASRTPGTTLTPQVGRTDGARATTRNGVSTQPPVGYPGTRIPDAPGRTRASDRGVAAPAVSPGGRRRPRSPL